MKKPLSELQQRVYNLLASPADADVPIYKLYEAAYQTNVHRVQKGVLLLGVQPRTMQQRLGSVIARINEKLDKGRVVPGQVKQTYRLDTKAE
jgi:hypothetical protein